MKQLQKGKRGKKPRKKTEPLAEDIRKEKRPRRFFTKMSDDELVGYAQRYLKERKICGRAELSKKDQSLYKVLRARGLVDEVGLENKHVNFRDWASMDDDELVEYAREIIEEKGLKSKADLIKVDNGLYQVLRNRNLLEIVCFEPGRRDWKSMGDDELVDFAKMFLEENGLSGRKELAKADGGLYFVLNKRKLLDRVIPESAFEGNRDWASMDDDELVDYSKDFIDRNGIAGRWGLSKVDSGLYDVLWKRELMDIVFPGSAERRDWASMSDEELVGYAREIIEEKGLKRRWDLGKVDRTLYQVLNKRKLLDMVIPESAHASRKQARDWMSMSDDELLAYARRVISEKRITKRHMLEKADSGLYQVLRRRKLLDAVFAPIESQRKREAVRQVVEAMEEFE